MFFQPRSLQQRTLFYILVPTFLLLVVLSIGGYMVVSRLLLTQWGENAIVRLQRTAHQVDMSLRNPKDLLLLLQGSEDSVETRSAFRHILRQIETFDWVADVSVEWPAETVARASTGGLMMGGRAQGRGNRHFRLDRFDISPPRYNNRWNNRTVSMVSSFQDASDRSVGRVEVTISFDALMEIVINSPWWQSNKAYLIDQEGNVLASTSLEPGLEDYFPLRAFGTITNLEKKTMEAMQQSRSGTVFGPGTPPQEISGYYRLTEAPWTMVVVARGEEILWPIIRFTVLYGISFSLCILLILFFIRMSNNRITVAVKELSMAAEELARGNFGSALAVTTRDEVGELTRSFNKMTRQLQHRLEMQEAIDVAREIQQNLLPQKSYSNTRVGAGGITLYCDETGGDYFDILEFTDNDQKVGVVVGDVVGHGIGAALLMTTVRALFRCRIALPGSLGEVISDVNRMLYRDTCVSGNFVTLFYLEADCSQKTMRWIRCGHDPAIVYSPATGTFNELRGSGVALGVDGDWTFEYNEATLGDEKQLICIGSDGVWEVENSQGELLGKERVKQLLAAGADQDPDMILKRIEEEISCFRGGTPQRDDITLVVVKIG